MPQPRCRQRSNADKATAWCRARCHDDFYFLEKARDAAFAREGVERLIGVFAVAPVDENSFDARSRWLADSEDAVCAAAAEASDCDALVTRDPDRVSQGAASGD